MSVIRASCLSLLSQLWLFLTKEEERAYALRIAKLPEAGLTALLTLLQSIAKKQDEVVARTLNSRPAIATELRLFARSEFRKCQDEASKIEQQEADAILDANS